MLQLLRQKDLKIYMALTWVTSCQRSLFPEDWKGSPFSVMDGGRVGMVWRRFKEAIPTHPGGHSRIPDLYKLQNTASLSLKQLLSSPGALHAVNTGVRETSQSPLPPTPTINNQPVPNPYLVPSFTLVTQQRHLASVLLGNTAAWSLGYHSVCSSPSRALVFRFRPSSSFPSPLNLRLYNLFCSFSWSFLSFLVLLIQYTDDFKFISSVWTSSMCICPQPTTSLVHPRCLKASRSQVEHLVFPSDCLYQCLPWSPLMPLPKNFPAAQTRNLESWWLFYFFHIPHPLR